MAKKSSIFFILASLSIILSQSAIAATIYGNIYDIELNQINNVVVEINSRPAQLYVAKNGSYEFFVPKGEYMLKASYYDDMYSEENISIVSEGNYALDLILMPNITETPPLENELITETFDDTKDYFPDGWMIILAILVVTVIVRLGWAFFVDKQKKGIAGKETKNIRQMTIRSTGQTKKFDKTEEQPIKKTTEELPYEEGLDSKVIEIIKKNGGRTTQKEIRKELPYSEAKISLVIAELEHKGIVEKIKKGRGNIILLKKK